MLVVGTGSSRFGHLVRPWAVTLAFSLLHVFQLPGWIAYNLPVMAYVARIVDGLLNARLRANGAVVIEGPKACGKTETARRQAASEVLLDIDSAAQRAAAIDPGLILDGPSPRLIDEWQIVPALWNHIRRMVDSRRVDRASSSSPAQPRRPTTTPVTPADCASGAYRCGR